MKVSNEYVQIKIGNKKFTKKNMILNKYLKKLFEAQLNPFHPTSRITRCFIKLDKPLENLNYDSNLNTTTDFDIYIFSSFNSRIIKDKKSVKIIYNFNNELFGYETEVYMNKSFDMFSGRKITAIGFGTQDECLAVVDTSNMNIIINPNEDILITRVDNYYSDGICKGFEYPLHLINDNAKEDEKNIRLSENETTNEYTMAKLYSVGFGNVEGLIEEEFLINDVEVSRDDNSITFNVRRNKKLGNYPSENLRFAFYPLKDNSKYLVFKYQLYRRYIDENYNPQVRMLNKFYTMSKPNEDFGDLNIKIKLERL